MDCMATNASAPTSRVPGEPVSPGRAGLEQQALGPGQSEEYSSHRRSEACQDLPIGEHEALVACEPLRFRSLPAGPSPNDRTLKHLMILLESFSAKRPQGAANSPNPSLWQGSAVT